MGKIVRTNPEPSYPIHLVVSEDPQCDEYFDLKSEGICKIKICIQ